MTTASVISRSCPVEIEALTKHYGDVRALDGVSLQAAPGEIFGLLGHNGAGKSTMIRILTGRAKPTSGRARVLGHDLPRELEAVRGQIFLTTPNMNDADELCQRAAFLAEGRLVALDTPRALKLSLANRAPEVEVVLDDGTEARLKLAKPPDAASLQELIAAGRIRSMHSLEPTPADVFIHLTGHSLEHDRAGKADEW